MFYRPTDSSEPLTRLNITGPCTSFSTQNNLEPGSKFIFSVTAFTRVGPGNTTSVTVSTLSAAVEGATVTVLNDTAVNVTWKALVIPDISVASYTVVYRELSEQDEREMSDVFISPATSGIITGLDPATYYQFQVFATVRVNGVTMNGERSTSVTSKCYTVHYAHTYVCIIYISLHAVMSQNVYY